MHAEPFGRHGSRHLVFGLQPLEHPSDVPAQNVMNTNGVDSAFVRVYDASPDYGFSCTLYAYSTTGAVLESESAITGTAFTGATTLYFEGLSSSSVGGHFGIYCSVPPGYSRIYSYRVKEFEQ